MAAWGREEQTSRAVEAEETMPEGGSPASRSQMTMAGPEAPGDQSSVSISAQVDQVQRRSIRAREPASSEVLIWIRKRMGSSSFVRSLTAGMPAAEIHRPGVHQMMQYIIFYSSPPAFQETCAEWSFFRHEKQKMGRLSDQTAHKIGTKFSFWNYLRILQGGALGRAG